jgi:hypothetical protein
MKLVRSAEIVDNLSYCGYAETLKYGKPKGLHPSIYACAADIPELLDYKLPSQEAADEKFALSSMTMNMRTESELSLHYLVMANEVVKSVTPRALRPQWFDRGLLARDILEVISRLDRSKHPGYPACLFGATKGIIIDENLVDLVVAVAVRMISLNLIAPYCETAEDLYRCFSADLTQVSIKTEFVKKTKNGRIIASNSIVSAVCEGLLYYEYNEAFKAGCYESYSAIGIGFTARDSALLRLSVSKNSASNDSPSFDSTTTADESILDVQVVKSCYGLEVVHNPRHTVVSRIMDSIEFGFCNKLFLISDGHVYVQTSPGLTPSGRDQTTNFNTQKRARRSYAVDLRIEVSGYPIKPRPICAGDDAIEKHHPRKELTYAELGFPIRDYEKGSDFEFCSHRWPEGETPVGLRIYKSTCTLLQGQVIDKEQVLAFCREYSKHERFPAVVETISVHRPEINILLEDIVLEERIKYNRTKINLLEMYPDADLDNFGDFVVPPNYSECAKKLVKKKSQMPQVRKVKGRGDYIPRLTLSLSLLSELSARLTISIKSLIKAQHLLVALLVAVLALWLAKVI